MGKISIYNIELHLETIVFFFFFFFFLFLNRTLLSSPSDQVTCQGSLGIEDGRITDNQLTASTVYTTLFYGASNARLNREAEEGSSGSWTARPNYENQWIQVAFDSRTWVTGVLLQGRPEEFAPEWVTKFKVSYSDNGADWEFVQQENDQEDMVRTAFQIEISGHKNNIAIHNP